MDEHLAVVGSGAIACGLAATAAHHGPVTAAGALAELGGAGARRASSGRSRAWVRRSTPSTCRS